MMAIGCIQAQRCHTGHCPSGIATQNRWLMRGLDPTSKSARLANYVVALRKELLRLSHACGLDHPANVRMDQFEVLDDQLRAQSAADWFSYPTLAAADATTDPLERTAVLAGATRA